jgi:hypothetical protein
MKRSAGIRATAIAFSSLFGSAFAQTFAQVDAPTDLEICKSFCAVSKNLCGRDLGRSSLAALIVADALDQANTTVNKSGRRSNDPASMAQLPTLNQAGGASPLQQALQQCESERLQCAQDCAQPKIEPETSP